MRRARMFLGVLSAAAILTGTALAGSATAIQSTITGYEVGVGTNSGTFLGFAETSGVPSGVWTATIVHDSLNTHNKKTTAITGGSVALGGTGFSFTWNNGVEVTITPGSAVTGTITGGTLVAHKATGKKTACTQAFDVSGTLTVGTFDGTLTHYGHSEHGTCVADFASFQGEVKIQTP